MKWFFYRGHLTGALTLRPPNNEPRDIPTLTKSPQNFCPLWQCTTVTLQPSENFFTVTFWPKVDGLFVHLKKWTVCHSVTFHPTVILANPWLWHFIHFWFWFLLGFLPLKRLHHDISGIWRDCSIRFSDPCRTVAWDVWQLKGLWHKIRVHCHKCPINRTPPPHGSAGLVP